MNNKYIYIFLYLFINNLIFSNISQAEDITISSNHSSQIVMSDNDTLTVNSDVTVDTCIESSGVAISKTFDIFF
jgi:hypothetical protein